MWSARSQGIGHWSGLSQSWIAAGNQNGAASEVGEVQILDSFKTNNNSQWQEILSHT